MKLIIWVIILAIAVGMVQLTPCNHSLPCTIRYGIAQEVHSLRGYQKCEDAYARDCVCSQPIDILFTETPPYIYTDPETKEVIGLIPGMLQLALDSCCYHSNCTTINYLKPYESSLEALKLIPVVTLLTPFVTYAGAETALMNTFVELVKSKGVAYVTSMDLSMMYYSKFFDSVGANWPLFCISLLLALDAGIIVWLLDSWQNKQDFPRVFHRGIIEGLWWAFVSMTTVGYGDKTPKTILARIFGILWITAGISLCGVFTASLTTGMTQSFVEEKLYLDEKIVGVMNKTRYEFNIAMREGAKVKEFSTYDELKNALKSGEVDGILLDALVLKYHAHDLEDEIEDYYLRMNAVKNSATSYGIVFSYDQMGNATNALWSKFLKGFYNENKDNLDMMVQIAGEMFPHMMHAPHAHDDSSPKSFFNDPKIYMMLFTKVGYITLCLLIFGFLYEKSWIAFRFYKASKQEKFVNKVEDKPKPRHRQSYLEVQDPATVRKLQFKFKDAMREIEAEDGNKDYSEITEKITERVFQERNSQSSSLETLIEMTEVVSAQDQDEPNLQIKSNER